MLKTLRLSLIALPIMLVLDLTWTGVVAYNFYKTEYGSLFAPHIIWQAAALFYVFYILALVHFVIKPGIAAKSLGLTACNAALLALVAYGTYDLTSLAVTVNWPIALTIVDMSWGVFCAIVTSSLTYVIATKIFKFK